MKRQWQQIIDENEFITREEFIDIQDECVVVGVDYNAPELGYCYSCSHQDFLNGDTEAKSLIIKLFGESVYQDVLTNLKLLIESLNSFKMEEDEDF